MIQVAFPAVIRHAHPDLVPESASYVSDDNGQVQVVFLDSRDVFPPGATFTMIPGTQRPRGFTTG